ncbi:GAF domain-containing protein [filamentous cyanobacterium LEGE 11480]|uniref:Circadian input-output histidine kinase CikA n=1 Tax=Romeriopsis navalis LEGE 11480 TaxID=2777977 RepID=A0A928VLJ2_9CYAN|nr:ATP-binding protein [Romeriopsis navalis]MBE9030823.1 GAF domain-containing protein [Romeriopsis navalis LEGE 11480]
MLFNACTADLKSDPESVNFLLLHDRSGHCLSIHWANAEAQGIVLGQMVGQPLQDAAIRPVSLDNYLQRFDRVLHTGQPEHFECDFQRGTITERLALAMAPLQAPDQTTIGITVTGISLASNTVAPTHPHLDSRHANQLAWKIRQTLDLNTIWQQAVNGLGEDIQVCRCCIYSIDPKGQHVTIEAEYRQPDLPATLGTTLEIAQDQALAQALKRFRPTDLEAPNASITPHSPCVVAQEVDPETQKPSTRLIIATGYQDKPNGLIVLEQCDRPRRWAATEVAFVRELADQVGTAIAHATLFNELQKASTKAVRKQEALEEARQQAEEASRLKSEFLANTSHELRTPLNGLMGFLKLVLDGMADDQEEQDEFLREAFQLSEHLLEVLNDVLNLAKIEAGKMQIECSAVNLNELLQDIDRQQGPSAYHKDLSCEVQMPSTLDPVIVYGNFKCLKQVLINLAGNAIKFTHEGGITITTEIIRKKVAVHDREFPGVAMVKVADTGIGVSLEKQDRLFQSFSQIDGSLTRRYGGTGLGLAISQRLIEEMGGTINFYSLGEGLGSTVTFTIPLFQEPVINSG